MGGGEALEQELCGGDRGAAIDVEGVLAAVVQDDVAGQTVSLVTQDALHEPGSDMIDVGGLPVGGHGIPEDRSEAKGTRQAQGIGPSRAEGRTEEADGLAEDGLKLVLGAAELQLGFAVGGEGEVGMAPAVVGDLVAGGVHLADEIGLECSVFADEEEGGTGVVAVENLEQPWGPARIGTVVEGESDLAR